jgi:anti-sigma regulatory factor (Ser/Thr protein kinase)
VAFSHSAFLYEDEAEYTVTIGRFVREGLRRGDDIAIAVSSGTMGRLRRTLGRDAGSVRFLAADKWHLRPVRTIAAWTNLLRAAEAPFTRVVSHIPYEGPHASWVRFEAALNRSLDGLDGHLLCPYDRRVLPEDLLAAADRTHPTVHDDGRWRDSAGYQAPERVLAEVPEPPFPVTGDPVLALPVSGAIARLRTEVRARSNAERWLPPDRTECLLLALSEIATNGIRHGGTRRELRLWVTHEAVVCEMTDDGDAPPGPLAGYLPPTPGMVGGMGLWLVQQLCDALSIRQSGGITRVRFALLRNP